MIKRVHCIGIGGIGLSGLARFLRDEGYEITGSDMESSPVTDSLISAGFSLGIGHDPINIPQGCSLVIYSHAIPAHNVERVHAELYDIEQMSYPEALGYFTYEKKVIAVTGTHGKTTTTAMLAKILIESGYDPIVIVGTTIPEWGHINYRAGKGKYFLVEACEHKRSFLFLQPQHVVLTNIDLDHLDYYQDKADYDKAFVQFVAKIPQQGSVVYFQDDVSSVSAVSPAQCMKVPVLKESVDGLGITVGVAGRHNRENGLLALTMAEVLGIDMAAGFATLRTYHGSGRRLEKKGSKGKTVFYDDYGHHPSEVAATLQALREMYPQEKVLCIYQPHQFSRTRFFLDDFPASFRNANRVIVPGIYEARDLGDGRKHEITEQEFVDALKSAGCNASFITDTNEIQQIALESDVVVVMGAGDVWKLTPTLFS